MKPATLENLTEFYGEEKAAHIHRWLTADKEEVERHFNTYVSNYAHSSHLVQLRLQACDLLAGTFWVEGFLTDEGLSCQYLNTGDAYAQTLLHYNGAFQLGSWGDVVEEFGSDH